MCNLEVASIDRPGNQTQLEVSPVQVLHFASWFARAQIRSNDCLNWSVLGVGAIRCRSSALPNFKTLKARATAKTAQGTRIHPGWVISECGCLVWSCWNYGGSWATWKGQRCLVLVVSVGGCSIALMQGKEPFHLCRVRFIKGKTPPHPPPY